MVSNEVRQQNLFMHRLRTIAGLENGRGELRLVSDIEYMQFMDVPVTLLDYDAVALNYPSSDFIKSMEEIVITSY